VAPIPIEDRIKAELPRCISNCILIGDKRKYLVVLVCLKCNIDSNTGEPLDDLTSDCISWLQSIGSNSTKTSDIIDHKDEIVYKEIENG
jgi:long-chain-fatty-acid--CoA ligase ACSBG